jgi:hypothetical protein
LTFSSPKVITPLLAFDLYENKKLLYIELEFGKWYPEDDFKKENGLFKDIRNFLTKTPALIKIVCEETHELILITPIHYPKPFISIEMIIHPKWDHVPSEFIDPVRDFFQR